MFSDTQAAIIYAYRKVGRQQIAASPVRPAPAESSRGLPDGQFVALVILGQIGQIGHGRHFLDARYSRNSNQSREVVRDWLFDRMRRDRWFLDDVLRRWGGAKPAHDFKWWAKHLRRDYSTIFRWKHRATDYLDLQLIRAESEIDNRLRGAGIVGD